MCVLSLLTYPDFVNNVTVQHRLQIALRDSCFIFLDIYAEIDLLNHMVVLFSCFEKPPYCFPYGLY